MTLLEMVDAIVALQALTNDHEQRIIALEDAMSVSQGQIISLGNASNAHGESITQVQTDCATLMTIKESNDQAQAEADQRKADYIDQFTPKPPAP